MIIKIFFCFLTAFALVGCFSKETNDPETAFNYWSGSYPSKDLVLMKGEYYQSGHFTLEYKVFLKFKSNDEWFEKFVEINKLEIDTIGNDWKAFTNLPDWFKPSQKFLIFSKDQSDEFETSRYFRNKETGVNYIYETIGM